MKPSLETSTTNMLAWLLGAAAVIAVVVVGAYVFKFGPGHWGTLSDAQGTWGEFGDYVGGILNPIFSSLAFVGLVMTVRLQAKQIDEARKYAEVEEMQRVLSSVSTRIDKLLASNLSDSNLLRLSTRWTPAEAAGGLVQSESRPTLFEVVSHLAEAAIVQAGGEDLSDWASWANADANVARHMRYLAEQEVASLAKEFDALGWMLLSYMHNHGSKLVMEFYKFRYGNVLARLNVIGLLEDASHAKAFFKVESLNTGLKNI